MTTKKTTTKPNKRTPKKTETNPDKPDTRPLTARTDPRNTDPTKPAADPKDELFCNYVSQNISITKSYQLAVNPRSRNISAASRGSEMGKRPDLARRIVFLQATRYKIKPGPTPKTPPPEAPQKPREAPKSAPLAPGQLITRADLEAIISAAVREASTATEKTQAVKLARDMLGLDRPEDAPVDPVALLDYITRTAGRTPAAIAQDTGGLRWMLDRLTSLSRLPRSQVLRTARAWTRSLAGETDQPDTPPDAAPGTPEPTQ